MLMNDESAVRFQTEHLGLQRAARAALTLLLLAAGGCSGTILSGNKPGVANHSNDPPASSTVTPTVQSANLSSRVIRLSLDEYQASVHELFPKSGTIVAGFLDTGAARQSGYTR